MKAIIISCLVLISTVSCQFRETTTEDILSAQNELSVGHEFTESLLQINRNIISSYIEIVQSQLLDSFMDTYSEIHIIADETTQQFDELAGENSCINAARNRWNIQIDRYGQKLSECLANSFAEISYWNNIVNNLHFDAQATTNLIQNVGVAELSDRDEFTNRESLGDGINMRFMQLLRHARNYLDTYEEFRASIIDNEEEIIHQLTECDRSLAAGFAIEAREDLERARSCF